MKVSDAIFKTILKWILVIDTLLGLYHSFFEDKLEFLT